MYTPGEVPQRYLDASFFAREAQQLNLTPDITQQFKAIVQSLVGQFEKDVNATSEGFISFLQQASGVSDKDILKELTKGQGNIEHAFQNLLGNIRTTLLKHVGSEYQTAIDHFVEDVREQLMHSLNLEHKVRKSPELDQLMPARHVFELAGGAKTKKEGKLLGETPSLALPPTATLDQKIAAVQKWLNTPGISDADKALAEQLLGELKTLEHSKGNNAQLQAWASGAKAGANSPYSAASSQAQARFASLTGVPQTAPPPPTPPPIPGGDGLGGLADFEKMMQRQQVQTLAVEYSIENLISMTAQAGKVNLNPQFIQKVSNQIMNTSHIHIAGYSPNQSLPDNGTPLPTNSWWTLLADDRGAGALGLQVVANGTKITDPKSQIQLKDALMFNPNAQVGQAVTVPYDTAFDPNVNQGAYNVQSYNDGFAFNPSEQYQTSSNGSSSYSQLTPYLMVAGAQQNLLFPPTVTTYDDHSATLVYQTKSGGSMTVPITRGSPYLTFQYQGLTPYFNSTATPIDLDSIHAYFYKQVVANVTDPNTQISPKDAQALGLDPTLGGEVQVENTNGPPWKGGIQGQVFTYSTMDAGVNPGDTYRLYFTSPVTLNPCNYITETVIPDSDPIPTDNPNHYIHDSTQKPYTTEQLDIFSQAGFATGLQASGPFTGTARIIKIPSASDQGKGGASLIQATLDEINALMAQGKNLADLTNWALGVLSDTNLIQHYPNLTSEDFNEFCQLTNVQPNDAEQKLAQTWLNRVPLGPDGQPLSQYKLWYGIAKQLNTMASAGDTRGQIQAWLQQVISSSDYKQLDAGTQQFIKTFAQFGDLNFQPASSLTEAHDAALAIKKDPDLYTQTLQLFDKDAWAIPLSGHYEVDGLGKWSYTYTLDTTVQPYAHFNPASSQLLIGLLKTDFSYLDGQKVVSDKIYCETIKGELEFVEAAKNKISFYDKDTAVTWPDDDLTKLSASDQLDLATKYINDVIPNLFLPDRHSNQVTYNMGKDVQNAADIAHGLWKLGQLNSHVSAIPGFQQAVDQAKHIAEAGLDDYLTGGLLEYDKTNGMVISTFGQGGEYFDYSNGYGEDHHFAYGYLIRAAAELRQVDPGWFQDPKYGADRKDMVNLLINDVFNVQNNPNYPCPRMRMWDPYIGIGRATGLVPPAGNGMNEESTAEDYNCIQGIALWGQVNGNVDLENQAATMAERVKNAAQAYWQPNSSTSIYTDQYAPEAAQEFAQKVVSCGVNWDNEATSANFFTPALGDPNIFTIAIEYITGNSGLVNYQAALAAFNYLINQNDSSGFARIFQNNVPLNTPGSAGYFSYISILISLIAQVSPHAATAILNWFQQANTLQPNAYAYDTGCNYGTIYQQILMARAASTHTDPVPSVNGFQSKLPALPPQSNTPVYPLDIVKGTALYYLSPWSPPKGIYAQMMPLIAAEDQILNDPKKLDDWVTNTLMQMPAFKDKGLTLGGIDGLYAVYKQLGPDGQKLMQQLVDEVDALKKQGTYSIQALQAWVNKDLLPTVSQQFPNLNAYDILTFCKITQLDLHAFEP